ALRQAYPGERQGRCARHLTTLAARISGLVASKSTQLPKVAAKVPTGTKPESRGKRFAHWLDNARVLEEVYFLPYAELLLAHLAVETLVLVMAGSVVGCGCVALMLHVLYKTNGVSRLQTNELNSTCRSSCHGNTLPPRWSKVCHPARSGGDYDHHH